MNHSLSVSPTNVTSPVKESPLAEPDTEKSLTEVEAEAESTAKEGRDVLDVWAATETFQGRQHSHSTDPAIRTVEKDRS